MKFVHQAIAVGASLLIAVGAFYALIVALPGAALQGEVAASLIGAAGTIFAGWLAWAAVQRQIAAETAYRENETRRSAVSDLSLACACVVRVANYLFDHPRLRPDPHAVETMRSLIAPCTRLDPNLGIALSSCVHELDLAELSRREAALDHATVRGLGFRCILLGRAFERARDQIVDGQGEITQPLVTDGDVAAERTRREQPDEELLFVRYLMTGEPVDLVDD